MMHNANMLRKFLPNSTTFRRHFVYDDMSHSTKHRIDETVFDETDIDEMSRLHTVENNIFGPRQANWALIAYASSEGSGEPAHLRSLARTFAARSYKHWIKRNLQTENQIPGPSEWLGMRSWNWSWRNARRHKFALRGSFYIQYSRIFRCESIHSQN